MEVLMATTVVNKHLKDAVYDEYIGRGSKWGNPYSHMDGTQALYKVVTREEAIAKYVKWFFTQPELKASVKELKGKKLGCYCHPAPCHGHFLARLADTTWVKYGELILECSSKGDIRYSAFGAEVEMFGKTATIEEHYQLSKRFIGDNGYLIAATSVYDIKGKNAPLRDREMFCIEVAGMSFPVEFREEFYKLMWLKYLDGNPDLVAYANHFADFNDIFKGKSIICQADCIRQYIKQGRESIVKDVEDFATMIGVEVS
jgi:hypothetical protein